MTPTGIILGIAVLAVLAILGLLRVSDYYDEKQWQEKSAEDILTAHLRAQNARTFAGAILGTLILVTFGSTLLLP